MLQRARGRGDCDERSPAHSHRTVHGHAIEEEGILGYLISWGARHTKLVRPDIAQQVTPNNLIHAHNNPASTRPGQSRDYVGFGPLGHGN